MMNNDRAVESIDLQGATKQDVLAAIERFLGDGDSGRIGFEKEGDTFSLWAIRSEVEPTAS